MADGGRGPGPVGGVPAQQGQRLRGRRPGDAVRPRREQRSRTGRRPVPARSAAGPPWRTDQASGPTTAASTTSAAATRRSRVPAARPGAARSRIAAAIPSTHDGDRDGVDQRQLAGAQRDRPRRWSATEPTARTTRARRVFRRQSRVAPIAIERGVGRGQLDRVVGVPDPLHDAEDDAGDDGPAAPQQHGGPHGIGAPGPADEHDGDDERDQGRGEQPADLVTGGAEQPPERAAVDQDPRRSGSARPTRRPRPL